MKKTALDKVLENFDAKIAALQAARAEVLAQQQKAPKRTRKPATTAVDGETR